MARMLLAVPLVAAALASGCAGAGSSAGSFEGEQKKVADKVEQLQTAGETGDAAEICSDILSKALRERMQAAGSNCEQELDKALQDADDFDLDVEEVTITGSRAIAKVKGQDRLSDLEFVREGSDWRAASLGS